MTALYTDRPMSTAGGAGRGDRLEHYRLQVVLGRTPASRTGVW